MITYLPYNKVKVAHAFSQAAITYDKGAVLQRSVGKNLLKKLKALDIFQQASITVLDLGSGSGKLTQNLAAYFSKSTIIAIDIAIGMLNFSKLNFSRNNIQWTCGDAEQLPLKNNCCDLVFSNLMLQWSPNYKNTLKEIRRVLKPNGILLCSTLGPNTLKELRHCWAKIDHYPHVHSFIPIQTMINAINNSQLNTILTESKYYYRYFSKAIDLLKELKMLGASNIHNDRLKNLTSKGVLQRVLDTYEKFRNKNNKLPATYEIYFILSKG